MHELSLSGSPKVILDAFDVLKRDVDVLIVSIGDGPLRERAQQIGRVVVASPHMMWTGDGDSGNRALRMAREFAVGYMRREIAGRIDAWRPDVVYANSVTSLGVYRLLDLSRYPLLLHVHELEHAIWANASRWEQTLRSAPRRYLAVADSVKENLVRRHAIDPDKISVVHEFVPDKDLPPETPSFDFDPNNVLIGGSGSGFWRKGMQIWLQTASELLSLWDKPGLKFQWIGGSSMDRSQFEITAAALRLSECVDFVPSTDKPLSYFSKFDLLAMTSIEDPCPLVVLESMMLGKPVLCFAGTGGAPDEVGDTGVVVQDYSPLAMAKAIVDLLNSPERMRQLGSAARARIEQNFAASIQAPKILAEIERLA